MENNQDNWEKIIKLTDEYQPNDSLASEVITKLNQRESTVKFRKTIPIWCVILAVGLAICIAVLLTYFLTNKKDVLYLSEENLIYNDITDINDFVETNNLNIKYIDTVNSYNKCATVKDDGRVAYIEQIFILIGENSFEQINLKIVLINADFEFYEYFLGMENDLIIDDIELQYYTMHKNERQFLYAKFLINNVQYYLEVSNVIDTDKSLEGIFDLLLIS